jgi:hypothetical protein
MMGHRDRDRSAICPSRNWTTFSSATSSNASRSAHSTTVWSRRRLNKLERNSETMSSAMATPIVDARTDAAAIRKRQMGILAPSPPAAMVLRKARSSRAESRLSSWM